MVTRYFKRHALQSVPAILLVTFVKHKRTNKHKDCSVVMMMTMIIIQPCFPSSWDNGDTEKMSPWDMEPIPDDGKKLCAHLKGGEKKETKSSVTAFNSLQL